MKSHVQLAPQVRSYAAFVLVGIASSAAWATVCWISEPGTACGFTSNPCQPGFCKRDLVVNDPAVDVRPVAPPQGNVTFTNGAYQSRCEWHCYALSQTTGLCTVLYSENSVMWQNVVPSGASCAGGGGGEQ